MGAKLGFDAKVYRQTTGSRATWGTATNGVSSGPAAASLDEIAAVRDVSYSITKGKANVSTRGNKGWAAKLGTLKEASLEITAIWDGADADMVALMGAFLTNANIALAILDGDKAVVGSQGLWADFQVTEIKKGEELEEGQTMTFTVEPGLSDVPPEWVKVAS